MKPYTLIITILLTGISTFGQPSDFIILKKKGKTVKSFYAGTTIEFVSHSGAYRNALITAVRNDSIFLQEFMVQQMMTQMGFYIVDTVGSFRYVYHYHDIKAIGKPKKGFDIRGSGAALVGGSVLLTLASGVVYLADREKFSPELLLASVGLGGIGLLMNKSGGNGMVIGKKNYRLEYMKMTGQ